jgi:sodium transport system ATP-binding protein
VHRPKNVLLDEPSSGLDVVATRGLRELILNLKQAGHCVLFSSHIMQEVAALSDEVVIISKGKVAAQGTPDELMRVSKQDTLEDAFVEAIGSEEGLF